MKIKHIQAGLGPNTLARATLAWIFTPSEKRYIEDSIRNAIGLRLTVVIQPGDFRPGKAWNVVGDLVADELSSLGVSVFYKAEGKKMPNRMKWRNDEIFVMDQAQKTVLLVPEFLNPMEVMFTASDPSMKQVNEFQCMMWLKTAE